MYFLYVHIIICNVYVHYIVKVIRLFSQNKINFLDERGIFFNPRVRTLYIPFHSPVDHYYNKRWACNMYGVN